MKRKCSTKIERFNLFNYVKTNWGDFAPATLVAHAQEFAVKDPARRTAVNCHSKAMLVLYSACLAAEQRGEQVPNEIIDVLGEAGKRLSPETASPVFATVFAEPGSTSMSISQEELAVLLKYNADLRGRTLTVV